MVRPVDVLTIMIKQLNPIVKLIGTNSDKYFISTSSLFSSKCWYINIEKVVVWSFLRWEWSNFMAAVSSDCLVKVS